MNKNNLINLFTNPQPVPSVYNEGFSQYETVSYLINYINNLIENQNLGSDEITDLKGKKLDLETYLNDIKNNRKLDENGDFKGTWNGLYPTQVDVAITDIINSLTDKLGDIVLFSNGSDVNSLLVSNKTVRIPVGNFVVDIVMPDNSILEGCGDSSWIQGSITIGSNCIVKNLKIGTEGKSVTFSNGVKNSRIENCTITKGDNTGALSINDKSVSDIVIYNCVFTGATSNGVQLVDKGTDLKHIENIQFEKCLFENNGRMNFEVMLRQDGANAITRGYKNINLVECILKGRTSQAQGQDSYINLSYDSNMLTDGTGQAGGYSTISNCTITDGFYAMELAGAVSMRIHDNEIKGGTTTCISSSNMNNLENNTLFEDNRIDTTKECVFNGNKNIIKNNKFKSSSNIRLVNCFNNEFSSNICISTYGGVLDVENSANNRIFNNILDNSACSGNSAPLRFFYAPSINNTAFNNVISKGTGGLYVTEQSGAIGNKIYKIITPTGFECIGSDASTSKYSVKINGADHLNYTFTNKNTGKQSYMFAKIKYMGRSGNSGIGGEITVIFGTYSDATAIPQITQSGLTATVTSGVDGNGYRTFTISTANGSITDYIGEVELIGANLTDWGF